MPNRRWLPAPGRPRLVMEREYVLRGIGMSSPERFRLSLSAIFRLRQGYARRSAFVWPRRDRQGVWGILINKQRGRFLGLATQGVALGYHLSPDGAAGKWPRGQKRKSERAITRRCAAIG